MISQKEATFVEQARKKFQWATAANETQRRRELEDLRFYAGDQWDPEVKQSRAGQSATNSLPPMPARPCYTINKLKEPVRQVLNQERGSDMGIELVAADDFGDQFETPDVDAEIELREGLCRRIQRESQAADARTWAFSRSTIAGVGYYGVFVRYLPGKTFDKEIYIHRFFNQSSVTLDPLHEAPDGSDAEFFFVASEMSWDAFKATYPKRARELAALMHGGEDSSPLDPSDAEWRALGDDTDGWFTQDGKTRSVRIVDYVYTEFTERELCLLADGTEAWKDELPKDATVIDSRIEPNKKITWCKLNGAQILEETEWEGPDLPIVKVIGEELHPYDHERRVEGMVRESRDAQQGYNAMVSKWVETVALAPIPPLQATPEQVEPFKDWYLASTTRTLPFLPYALVNAQDGSPLPPPTATPREVPIDAIAGSVRMFDMGIQATTGVSDPQLGKVDPSARSGRAIKLLQEQAMHGTSNYLDNLRRSIRYEGQIINNLLYPIYGKKPGRILRILTSEGESRPIPLAADTPPPAPEAPGLMARLRSAVMGPPATPAPPPNGKQYRLTPHARFNVIVKVTKSFESRRTQEATTIAEMLTAQPQLMSVYGDLFFKNQDGPGHLEMAERAKIMLDPKIQQYLANKEKGVAISPEAQAQMAQMMAQLQQQGQVLEKMHQALETKQVEAASRVQLEQVKGQATLAKGAQDAETRVKVAEIQAAASLGVADVKANLEQSIELMSTQLQTIQGLVEAHQAQLDRMHEREMAATQQQHERDQATAAAAQQSALQAQQAAQQPPSPNGTGA